MTGANSGGDSSRIALLSLALIPPTIFPSPAALDGRLAIALATMSTAALSSLLTMLPFNRFPALAPQRSATRSELPECSSSLAALPADILAQIALYLDCVDLQSVVVLVSIGAPTHPIPS